MEGMQQGEHHLTPVTHPILELILEKIVSDNVYKTVLRFLTARTVSLRRGLTNITRGLTIHQDDLQI